MLRGKKVKFQVIAGVVVSSAILGHSFDLHNHMDAVVHKVHLPHQAYEQPKWPTYTTVSTTTMSSATTTTTA